MRTLDLAKSGFCGSYPQNREPIGLSRAARGGGGPAKRHQSSRRERDVGRFHGSLLSYVIFLTIYFKHSRFERVNGTWGGFYSCFGVRGLEGNCGFGGLDKRCPPFESGGRRANPQGLKPIVYGLQAARLKPCPSTKAFTRQLPDSLPQGWALTNTPAQAELERGTLQIGVDAKLRAIRLHCATGWSGVE